MPKIKYITRCLSCRSLLLTELEICVEPRKFLGMTFMMTCPVCHDTDDFPLIEPILGEVK